MAEIDVLRYQKVHNWKYEVVVIWHGRLNGRNSTIFGKNTMCYKIIRENGKSQMHTLYRIYYNNDWR